MKKIISVLALFLCLSVTAQTKKKPVAAHPAMPTVKVEARDSFKIKVDSLLSRIDTLIQINNEVLNHLDINTSLKGRYKMYQTENIYNLIKLDTKTGRLWQVQWTLDDKYREGSSTINDDDLTFGVGYGSGSFELYPTKNMYQFILLDKTDGRMWHVQWGMKSAERWIRRMF